MSVAVILAVWLTVACALGILIGKAIDNAESPERPKPDEEPPDFPPGLSPSEIDARFAEITREREWWA